jgi:hypothetical protein
MARSGRWSTPSSMRSTAGNSSTSTPTGSCWTRRRSVTFRNLGYGLDVNAAGDLLLCGTRPGFLVPDAWVRLTPSVGKGWTVPWVYKIGQERIRRADKGLCVRRGSHRGRGRGVRQARPERARKVSRGFVVEFGVNGAKLSEAVATASPAWQSGYEAVAPDGDGGYVAVGYTCDAKVTPCTPTRGVVNVVLAGGVMTWGQPVTTAATVWGVAASPSGGVVVAAEALIKGKGFLAQAWAPGKGDALMGRTRARSAPFRSPRGSRSAPTGTSRWAATSSTAIRWPPGSSPAPLLAGHEHAASVQGEQRSLVEGFAP